MTLTENTIEQIHFDISESVETWRPCHRHINTTFPGAPDHRPYPFPVQWLSIWHPYLVPGLRPETADNAAVSCIICSLALSEAYLSIPCSRLLRLPAAQLLPRPEISFAYTLLELSKTCIGAHGDIRNCFWPLYLLGSARSSLGTPFSVLARSMSCVLGTEYMGYVFIL